VVVEKLKSFQQQASVLRLSYEVQEPKDVLVHVEWFIIITCPFDCLSVNV